MKPYLLFGHSRPLTCVLFNRDGDLLFTCGKDSTLALWRTEDGEQIGTYNCGKGVIWNCDVTMDSRRVVAASADQKIIIFDVYTGEELYTHEENGPCRYVEWNKKPGDQNKVVLVQDAFGGKKNTIKVWEINREEDSIHMDLYWEQSDYPSRCVAVHWGPFDETIISCHDNGSIFIWDASTGEYINNLDFSDEGDDSKTLTCMSFSDDRLLALACWSDGVAKLFDCSEWACLKTYVTDRPLNTCGISPRYNKEGEERRLHIMLGGGQAAKDVTMTSSSEGKFEALLYHMVYEEEVASIKGHFGPLNTLCFMPNGNGYVSGGEDGYARIYTFDNEYFSSKFE